MVPLVTPSLETQQAVTAVVMVPVVMRTLAAQDTPTGATSSTRVDPLLTLLLPVNINLSFILRRMANSYVLIDTAGDAGASDSGDAVGGDAVGDPDTTPVKRASDYASANGHAVNGHAVGYPATAPVKRASDYATAGGNAYTGSTGNTGSGNIVNEAGEGGDDTSTLTNTGPSSELLFLFPVAAVLLTAVPRRCRCRRRFYDW